ncbi:MAG TPA: metallophosphoesterase family protein [Nocardioidaceae bacterium]|nr:metallophosphoesterase family protein [Nocardioidaceae bacterium]
MTALYVVSDVHGHLDDLHRVLADAGLVDEDGDWAGANAELWLLGDLVDRGPNGIGVIRLMRALQDQAPENVHVLLGNHEALALGMNRFPAGRIADSWMVNGGRFDDQEALTEDEVRWLADLPAMGRVGDYLLTHSDITTYLEWGSSIEQVNDTVRAALADPTDEGEHWQMWTRLTGRYAFAGRDGATRAARMLETYGGECLVHGHSIIGSLLGVPSAQVDGPIMYAEGQVIAIDGGRYDGGPLLLVRLD